MNHLVSGLVLINTSAVIVSIFVIYFLGKFGDEFRKIKYSSKNIDMDDNALDFNLAKSTGAFFRLNAHEMDTIIKEVVTVVKDWKSIAKKIGIPKKEQLLMEPAFNTEI